MKIVEKGKELAEKIVDKVKESKTKEVKIVGNPFQEIPVGVFLPLTSPEAYKPPEGSVYYHMDAPIRKTIAMLNLLGCETTWSCCGHGYNRTAGNEANVNKDHAPNFQIFVKATPRAFEVCKHVTTSEALIFMQLIIELKSTPTLEPYLIIQSRPFADARRMWGDPNSPHFHETPNIFKTYLNRALMELEKDMVDEVTIGDYNAVAVEKDPHWQYRPANEWVIKKEDLPKIP